MVDPATTFYQWTYAPVTVSAGADRIEEDEAMIDFNSPIRTKSTNSTSSAPEFVFGVEGVHARGADTGEPGYAGFGFCGTPVATFRDGASNTRHQPCR